MLGKHLRAPGDTADSPVSLGAAAGSSLNGVGQRLTKVWKNLHTLQQAGLPKQATGALLRTYAGAASQNALRLELAGDVETEAYDGQIRHCWAELLGRDIDGSSKELLGLPGRLGGIGVQYASTRRYAAYLASWSAAASEVASDVGCSTVADCLDRLPAVTGKLEIAREGLVQQGLRICDGGSVAEAVCQELRQGLAVEKVQMNKHAALLQQLPLSQRAELRGAGGPGAGSFLAYPPDALCTMEDAYWETAVRHRVKMEKPECRQSEEASRSHTCINKTVEGRVCSEVLDSGGVHGSTCQCGGGVVRKHGRIAKVTGSLVKRWRCEEPLYEQRVPSWDRQRLNRRTGQAETERAVLDVEYLDDDGRRWLDVSVRHLAAGADAQITRSARRNREASRRGEREKHARYPGDRLTPLVFETQGRVGAEARQWLSTQVAGLPEDEQQSELVRAYKCLSSTLQTQLARQLRSAAGVR